MRAKGKRALRKVVLQRKEKEESYGAIYWLIVNVVLNRFSAEILYLCLIFAANSSFSAGLWRRLVPSRGALFDDEPSVIRPRHMQGAFTCFHPVVVQLWNGMCYISSQLLVNSGLLKSRRPGGEQRDMGAGCPRFRPYDAGSDARVRRRDRLLRELLNCQKLLR